MAKKVTGPKAKNVKTLLRYTGQAGRRIVDEQIGDERRTIVWDAGNDFLATVEDAALLEVLMSEGDFLVVANVQPPDPEPPTDAPVGEMMGEG